ncbi:MBL fold metallo-hydrolase [Thermogemmatispora sp.]|uniref:MBL fold metallo-hydrolase n=1 Tax=Thermogemmatispora sp. TaxID=1968838 RepID=UPI0035E41A5B
MTTRLTFLGVAGYEIAGPRYRILIDPFLSGNPAAPRKLEELEPPDAILVSHAAFDHFGDTYTIAARTGAPVICGGEVRALLLALGLPSEQVRAVVWGLVLRLGELVVRPVECHHWSQATLPDGSLVSGVPMGFIVEPEPDVRIYHYGDTALFSDLRLIGDLYRPTIGLLGCTQPQLLLRQVPGPGELLTGEMSPREAALAAEYLGLRLAVASHYLDLANQEGNEYRDVQEFLLAVHEFDRSGQRQAVALMPGESLLIDGDHYLRETLP